MQGQPGDRRRPDLPAIAVGRRCTRSGWTIGPGGKALRGGCIGFGESCRLALPTLPKGEGTDAGKLPMICGLLDLKAGQDELYWAVKPRPPRLAPKSCRVAAPAKVFRDGIAYLESIERVRTETPDARLDAAVAAVCHPMDAACNRNPFVFQHGCMSFHIPFLGWRVICGSTALGWHDRVKGNAAFYIAAQVKEDNVRTQPQPDAERRYCHEGPQSRFYGRGHISNSPTMYNTQSQFFDQTIRDWRWTGDRELEKILRPALELHLEWARQCFDPDDDGLYESYINTLPTDSVWYNGGGSVEEIGLRLLRPQSGRTTWPQRAGDAEAAARHQARAEQDPPRSAEQALAGRSWAFRSLSSSRADTTACMTTLGSTASFCRSTPA